MSSGLIKEISIGDAKEILQIQRNHEEESGEKALKDLQIRVCINFVEKISASGI